MNPQRLGSLQQLTIAAVDRAREMAINGWVGDSYLYSQSQALLAENLGLSRQLQTLEAELQALKSLSQSGAMGSHDTSPNDQAHSSCRGNSSLESSQGSGKRKIDMV